MIESTTPSGPVRRADPAGRTGYTGPPRKLRTRRALHGALSTASVLVATFVLSPVPMASALGPTPSPSQSALQLPVIPAQLGVSGSACTRASRTTMTAVPWAQQSLEIARAQQLSQGSGVTVAVVDTGVSSSAPALAGRVSALGPAGHDCVGHGTFVAGLIAARSSAGVGFSGVAPGARILAVRGTDQWGTADPRLVASGIRAAVDAGAEVIDVSLALQADTAGLTSAVAYAARHDVLVVAAATPDNTYNSGSAPVAFWPAARPGVLSVEDVDIDGARPNGSLNPARADLAAPGDGVTSIGPAGRGHFIGNGSSVAAALVAGAAALVRAYHPDLTAPQVAQRLEATAYPATVPRLDPYGALVSVLPAAAARSGPGPSSAIRLAAPVSHGNAAERACAVAAACAALALCVWAAAALGRRRRGSVAAAVTPSAGG